MSEMNLSGIFGNLNNAGKDFVFKNLDANGDGKIDKEEFETGIKEYAGEDSVEFSSVDTNGDNVITREEYEAAMGAIIETGEKTGEEKNDASGNQDNSSFINSLVNVLGNSDLVASLLQKLLSDILKIDKTSPEVESPKNIVPEDIKVTIDELDLPKEESDDFFEKLVFRMNNKIELGNLEGYIDDNFATKIRYKAFEKLIAAGISREEAKAIVDKTYTDAMQKTLSDYNYSGYSLFGWRTIEKDEALEKFLNNYNQILSDSVMEKMMQA